VLYLCALVNILRVLKPLFLLHIFCISLLLSCGDKQRSGKVNQADSDTTLTELEDALKKAETAPKPAMDSVDLKKSIKKIEAKYGEQWDFCDCVVKGDSINKAFSRPNIPDKEFERLSSRFDEIDKKCQAFRIQDANRTPDERMLHEKKVNKCLRAAGIRK
jgi:hypothetical protein